MYAQEIFLCLYLLRTNFFEPEKMRKYGFSRTFFLKREIRKIKLLYDVLI